jgi:GT2 family glycosyltransferase
LVVKGVDTSTALHPLKLSIVIVNYNVRHFLEQCLLSVKVAIEAMDAEVFVVDNNSVDGSVAMVQERFPWAKLIANKENTGFSVANNQAIREAVGEYVLLLNPDTVVEADTFTKCIEFMDEHPDSGGLGVRMVDGKGDFLPESKRSLPTPEVAFYKVFGLSGLFPKSKRFGKYHLGFLPEDKTNEVEVLSGAYMMMRKETLDKVGLLDETFFMYGEDIDLSYRIIKGGYKNYYFPEARIIHYKGESTKKGSLNYVYVFYNAMAIFAKKHFSSEQAKLFQLLINFAILFRAGIALMGRMAKQGWLPLIDALVLYGGLFGLAKYWEANIKFEEGLHYPPELYYIVIPGLILVWLISVFFTGGYDRPVRLLNVLKGTLVGSSIALMIYALMPETIRFSRAIILLGGLWSCVSLPLIRWIANFIIKGIILTKTTERRFAIVGLNDELDRVEGLLKQTFENPSFIGFVSPSGSTPEGKRSFLGDDAQLKEIIRVHDINEVIFCAKDVPAREIIDQMSRSAVEGVDFKIAPQESMFLIGSNSINTSGDLYTVGINSVGKASNKRLKRLFDVVLALILLPLWILVGWFTDSPVGYLKNVVFVLLKERTWVGYAGTGITRTGVELPPLPKAVITMADVDGGVKAELDPDLLYARNYRVSNDLLAVLKHFRRLGRG